MYQSFPRQLGRSGVTSFAHMAEIAVDKAAKGRKYAVTIGHDRRVHMVRIADANEKLIAATFVRGSDPDWLAEEMRFAAERRGLL